MKYFFFLLLFTSQNDLLLCFAWECECVCVCFLSCGNFVHIVLETQRLFRLVIVNRRIVFAFYYIFFSDKLGNFFKYFVCFFFYFSCVYFQLAVNSLSVFYIVRLRFVEAGVCMWIGWSKQAGVRVCVWPCNTTDSHASIWQPTKWNRLSGKKLQLLKIKFLL